jgi:hypothetical protein
MTTKSKFHHGERGAYFLREKKLSISINAGEKKE